MNKVIIGKRGEERRADTEILSRFKVDSAVKEEHKHPFNGGIQKLSQKQNAVIKKQKMRVERNKKVMAQPQVKKKCTKQTRHAFDRNKYMIQDTQSDDSEKKGKGGEGIREKVTVVVKKQPRFCYSKEKVSCKNKVRQRE